MAAMISPEGERHEIDAEGVAALEALGWEQVEFEVLPELASHSEQGSDVEEAAVPRPRTPRVKK